MAFNFLYYIMKPILHIKLPKDVAAKRWDTIYKHLEIVTDNEYHIILTYDVDIQVLNGEQLTELTFEQFKQQYIK